MAVLKYRDPVTREWVHVAAGQQGPTGPQGPVGEEILHGQGGPSAETGDDGDYYLDLGNQVLYGPKGALAYGGTEYEVRHTTNLASDVLSSALNLGVKFKVDAPARLGKMSIHVNTGNAVDTGWRLQLYDMATSGVLLDMGVPPGFPAGGWTGIETPLVELVPNAVYLASVYVPVGASRTYKGQWDAEERSGPLVLLSKAEGAPQGVYGNVPDGMPDKPWDGYLPGLTPVVQGADTSMVWPVALVGASGAVAAEGSVTRRVKDLEARVKALEGE